MLDFKPNKWAALSPGKRIDLLQKVENRVAAEENREPRTIVPQKMDVNGEYRPETPKYIFINEDLINSTELDEYVRYGYAASQAMQTVLHEGRHAYQDDCVKGKNAYINGVEIHGTPLAELAKEQGKLDDETLNLWKMQDLIYFRKGDFYLSPPDQFLRYFFQPVEADAESFSMQKLLTLAEQVNDHDFWESCDIQVSVRKTLAKNAETMWKGPDFREKIAQDVVYAHTLLLMKEKSEQETSTAAAPKRTMKAFTALNSEAGKCNLVQTAFWGGILLYMFIMYLIAAPSGFVSHLLWFMAAMIPFLPVILLLRFFPKLHNKKGGILLAAIFGVFLLLMQLFYSWLSLLFLVGTAWVLLKGLGSAAPNLLTITRENADGTTTTETRIVGDDMAAEIAGAKAQLRSEGYTDIREG